DHAAGAAAAEHRQRPHRRPAAARPGLPRRAPRRGRDRPGMAAGRVRGVRAGLLHRLPRRGPRPPPRAGHHVRDGGRPDRGQGPHRLRARRALVPGPAAVVGHAGDPGPGAGRHGAAAGGPAARRHPGQPRGQGEDFRPDDRDRALRPPAHRAVRARTGRGRALDGARRGAGPDRGDGPGLRRAGRPAPGLRPAL
ncbi:MAG: CDP-diacylglycerol--glycerol-3-phosphate 3-phosphatidyltransferase, partial [uncultured Pseudonocardia sp.]